MPCHYFHVSRFLISSADCRFNCHKRCASKVPRDCLGEVDFNGGKFHIQFQSYNGISLIFRFSIIWMCDVHVQSQSAPAQTLTPPWILWKWTVVKWTEAEDWMIQRNRPPQRKGCSTWILHFWTERRMKSPSRQLGTKIQIFIFILFLKIVEYGTVC